MVQFRPYNPQADPKQYLAQALQQGVGGFLENRQRRQFSKGLSPTLAPIQLMQKALMAGYPMQQALQIATMAPKAGQGFTLGPGQTRFGAGGQQIAKGPPKLTKRQQLKQEGYNPEEVRRIMDIEHGLEPRASSRTTYDQMTLPEKAKYLSTERERAEGQYYGTPDQLEVRQPKYLKWILKEQAKVEKAMGQKSDLTPAGQDPTPQTKAEYDAIPAGTWFMDTDGKRKRKK